MNRCILLALCLCAHVCLSQDYNFSGASTDKSQRRELAEKIRLERQYLDSVLHVRKIDSLEQRYSYLNIDTMSYFSVTFAGGFSSGNYEALLKELEAAGFNTRKGIYSINYGFTIKKKRFIHEVLISVTWGDKMKSDNHETVQLSGGSFFTYMVGFDLFRSPKFSLYPYVSLSHEMTSLQYSYNASGHQSYDNFLDIAADVSKMNIRKNALHLGLGGEFDYYFSKSNRHPGLILGLRYGLTEPILESKYKVDENKIDYDTDVTLRKTYFALVLRIFARSVFDKQLTYR